ncbi:MAG TPA: methyltransferase domain-containing protein [Candidatus Nanoarchaeia archaeon]|nr:methyltransferase domain-containing protein [Candidatus Nanoarchaeia archaeon]
MDSRQYWNKKIIDWENSINQDQRTSLIESLAGKFRKPLLVRKDICLELLKKVGKGKTVLELGCGSGFFAFKALKEVNPKKIIGIDISRNAISRAKKIKKDLGIGKEAEFIEGDTSSMNIPAADVTVGLGFLDYLTAEEIINLMKRLKSKHIIFTFSEKKASFYRYLHILYLISQHCPKHYYYTKEEMARFIKTRYKNVRIISGRKLMFGCVIHNVGD